MKILFWNTQGVVKPSFRRCFKDCVIVHKPKIIAMMETHTSGKRVDRIINNMGYINSFRIEAQGHSGGIWILWDNLVKVKILSISKQYVHAPIKDSSSNCWNYFTTIYASPNPNIRCKLCDLLEKLKPCNNEPWILGGDFNCILKPDERIGGSNRFRGGSKYFQDFIFNKYLIDVKYQGDEFTWRRGNLWQRLDRCIMNIKWLELYPDTRVHHLDRTGSYHCLILLHTINSPKGNKKKQFRFLADWMEHPDFEQFIKKEWVKHDNFMESLTHIKESIKVWNSEVFGNINQKKKKLVTRLKGINKALRCYNSTRLTTLEAELKIELETILRQEDLLWAQRARCKWITHGDKNTKYFHSCAITKGMKNL
ncbi:uncharacterized protein LOC120167094 [Hibiscus syriacus]|uniref:uncharacterized protein LOC120167094 n=1 Tax=Hibiscus syriacus TaxID=106335 RepID=UPI00192269D8|nr:uncharacterized protein LOC120167094 [Hibiscus syriacus]